LRDNGGKGKNGRTNQCIKHDGQGANLENTNKEKRRRGISFGQLKRGKKITATLLNKRNKTNKNLARERSQKGFFMQLPRKVNEP